MAKYRTDKRDLEFNLFELLTIQEHSPDFEESDLKEILIQFDKFVESEIYPTRAKGDEEGVKLTQDRGVTVPTCFKQAAHRFYENGWFTLGYPEDIGGMPTPHALGFACSSLYIGANMALSLYPSLSAGAMNVILQIGSEEQKNCYIPPMMEGRWGGTMCLTEPGAGSDVGAAKTMATPNADGTYNIQGVKIFISSGESDIYENIIHLVLARMPDAPKGTRGLSLFIVPRFLILDDAKAGASNHVKCTKIEEKMGIHGSATCELTFGGEGPCRGWLVGQENQGMANMFIMMNEARLLCGIQGESQASLVYQLTEQYAKERVQFETEICHLPDVKRMLLKMRAMSRGLRTLILYTANLFDLSEKGGEEVEAEIAFMTPICKSFCTDEGFQVAVDAVQVHGGYGFCTEYGIEQFVRDAKIATIYEGTNGIQAIDFVMRKILKDRAAVFKKVVEKIQKTLAQKECQEWKAETSLLVSSLEKAQGILEQYEKAAREKKEKEILTSATDFLGFCGNVIVAWRLLDSAILAKRLMGGNNSKDNVFFQSKVTDFKVFCQYYLTRNSGLAQSILSFSQNIAVLEV